MRALQRRCHRLLWLNPLLGRPTYEPRVEGMAASLPYVDDFLPVHNLHSLYQLAEHLQSMPRRRRTALDRAVADDSASSINPSTARSTSQADPEEREEMSR